MLLVFPTLLIVATIVFLTVRLIPGDVVELMIVEMRAFGCGGQGAEAIDREAIERSLGLDAPIHIQYGRWLGGLVLRGDLGVSLREAGSVSTLIFGRIGTTFELGFFAILIGLVVALPIGIYSAIRQNTIGDYLGRSFAIIFISVPSFWTATIIMIYPALWWGWSPPMELIPFGEDPLANLSLFVVPSGILGMFMAGTTMRMTRTMMLEVLRQDYIRTAWAKGLKERVIIIKHAMKNALIPVVTVVGLQLPVMVGGAVIIEQIFNLPGLGRLMITSLSRRDYPIVSGINLVIATVVVVVNVLVDMSYAYLDPRIRYR